MSKVQENKTKVEAIEVNGVKLTENQGAILKILAEQFTEGAFAADVLEKAEGKTFNAVNATLASLATKGLVSKVKAVRGDKMLTKYTVVNAAD